MFGFSENGIYDIADANPVSRKDVENRGLVIWPNSESEAQDRQAAVNSTYSSVWDWVEFSIVMQKQVRQFSRGFRSVEH